MSNVIGDIGKGIQHGIGTLGDIFAGPGIDPSLANMPPEAAAIYQQQLGDYRNMLSQYQGGAASPYVQAMQAPVQQAGAQALGSATQQQGLRGIRGSSFGEQSLANIQQGTAQDVANVGAQAQYNQLQQQMGLQGAIGGIGQAYQGQGGRALEIARMNQEARQKGLGALGGLAGGIGGFMLGGPAGAALGSGLGGGIGQRTDLGGGQVSYGSGGGYTSVMY